MLRWKRDLYIGIFMLLFSIFSIIYAENMDLTIQTVPYPIARADRYMEMWLIGLALLSLALIVRAVRSRSKETVEKIWTKSELAVSVTLVLFLIVLPKIGFIVSGTLLLTALFSIFNLTKAKKTSEPLWKRVLYWFVLSVVLSTAIFFLFTYALEVRLPVWSLF